MMQATIDRLEIQQNTLMRRIKREIHRTRKSRLRLQKMSNEFVRESFIENNHSKCLEPQNPHHLSSRISSSSLKYINSNNSSSNFTNIYYRTLNKIVFR